MEEKDFAAQLIQWYIRHQRNLPWRKTKDPYKIWLSEIILQQTRVNQGMPYYLRFIENYPTVFDLANAKESEVLRHWQGLGYYSRARNLHACAKTVVETYEGKFPETYEKLLKLRGIGKYTAAAIASFAFNKAHAVVDGNVYRVLSRVFGIMDNIASNGGAKVFEQKANALIDANEPDTYNQAIMEFGAIHCTPLKPACALCPVSIHCYAFNHNMQNQLPVKIKKVKVRTRYFHYLVFKEEEKLRMKERTSKDIWRGLFDFKLIEDEQPLSEEDLVEMLPQALSENVTITNESKIFKHILTHQRIFATFYQMEISNTSRKGVSDFLSETEKYSLEEIKALPKPKLIDKYLEEFIF